MESFNFVGVGARPWMVKAKKFKKKSQAKPNQTKTTLIKQPPNKNNPLNKQNKKQGATRASNLSLYPTSFFGSIFRIKL